MKTWVAVAAGALLLGTAVAPAGTASAKEPPQPAFGKELVPDQAAQKDPKAAGEIDEEIQEKDDEAAPRPQRRRSRGGHSKRVHIQLDGDEDGGGDDSGDF